MAASTLAAFQKDLETARRDFDRFAELYKEVLYHYYHSRPPARVPDEVWQYISESYGGAYKLDIAPDGTACLHWEETFAAEQFRLLCKQCCQLLRIHAKLIAAVPEVCTTMEMPSGYHQWIHMIHRLATVNLVWSGLLSKWLVVSQRPFEETRKERCIGSASYDNDLEPEKAEEQLIREMNEQGKAVPDVWFEQITYPLPVVKFHRQMLDMLEELVQQTCPDQEGLHAPVAPQQPVPSQMPKPGDAGADLPQLVTLNEVAPLVHRSKRTLENYKKDMPPPRDPGGGGKASFWDWRELRPWLEGEFNMTLPERFPKPIPPTAP